MTLQQLIDQFRAEVGDTAAPFMWPDASVLLWINEAIEEAATRAKLIKDKSTVAICQINVIAGTSTYALDSRVLEIAFATMGTAGNAALFPTRLGIVTTDELDQARPAWRATTVKPSMLIKYDNSVEVDGIPDANYIINLEVYRRPLTSSALATDTPEINAMHHRHLVKWVKFRAYQRRDADTQDPIKSEEWLKQFEEVFGGRALLPNQKIGDAK